MEMKKKKDQNQSIYVTLIVILVALAVAVGITSVVGKKIGEPEVNSVLQTDEEENVDASLDGATEDTGGSPVFENKAEAEKNGAESEKDDTEEAANTVKPEDTQKTEPAESSEDAAAQQEEAEEVLPEFASPVSGYLINGHSDTVPVFSVTMNDYRTHIGVDIFAEPGEAVRAAADGVIGAIWEDPMMGTCMTVVHSGGAVSTYKGIYSTIPDGIAQGVAVTKGQPIAAVGDTALAEVEEESHVHYELAVDGVPVDPCLYMEFNEEVYEN